MTWRSHGNKPATVECNEIAAALTKGSGLAMTQEFWRLGFSSMDDAISLISKSSGGGDKYVFSDDG
jgi:hypothetical protein